MTVFDENNFNFTISGLNADLVPCTTTIRLIGQVEQLPMQRMMLKLSL